MCSVATTFHLRPVVAHSEHHGKWVHLLCLSFSMSFPVFGGIPWSWIPRKVPFWNLPLYLCPPKSLFKLWRIATAFHFLPAVVHYEDSGKWDSIKSSRVFCAWVDQWAFRTLEWSRDLRFLGNYPSELWCLIYVLLLLSLNSERLPLFSRKLTLVFFFMALLKSLIFTLSCLSQ